MNSYTLPAAKQALDVRERVTPQVEQMAGHSADGTLARDSVRVRAEESGGHMTGIRVTDVTADGAFEKYFAVKQGDVVTDIGPLPVRDMGSAAEAKDMLTDAYQRSGSITVVRDGKKMTLPPPGGAAAAAAAAGTTPAAPAAPAQPAGATPTASPGGSADHGGSADSVEKQLDAIKNLPR
jgi:hypothetical protein